MLNIIRPSHSESMQGILSQPRPSRGNEYGHSGVQYDAFFHDVFKLFTLAKSETERFKT